MPRTNVKTESASTDAPQDTSATVATVVDAIESASVQALESAIADTPNVAPDESATEAPVCMLAEEAASEEALDAARVYVDDSRWGRMVSPDGTLIAIQREKFADLDHKTGENKLGPMQVAAITINAKTKRETARRQLVTDLDNTLRTLRAHGIVLGQ